MKKINFILLFLVSTNFIFAQKQHKVTLTPSTINLQSRQFFVKDIIDARPNKETIGYAQKGLSNRRVNANFSEPFTVHLQKAFDKMMPAQEGLTPVLAKVHNLYVSETTTAWKETGIAEIGIEFLSIDSTSSYGFYQAVEKKNGADVTKNHDKRILTALTSCLTQLTNKWDMPNTEVLDFTTVVFDPNQPIKKGVYLSFSDFILNEPLDTIEVAIEKLNKKADLYKITHTKTEKKLKKVYGVFDGTDFYLNAAQYSYQTHFTKAQFKGRFIYFEDKVSNTGATIAFGLIGALASAKTIGVVLDTETGLISELTRDYLAIILKEYPELRKMYNDSDKKLPVKKAIVKKLNGLLADR